MALEQFDACGTAADLTEPGTRLRIGHFLVSHHLEVLAHPQPSRITRCSPCRQDVVGADHLVPVRDACSLAQEQRSVVAHFGQRLPRIGGEDLDVLAGVGANASSRSVVTTTSPWSRQAGSAKSLVGIVGRIRST